MAQKEGTYTAKGEEKLKGIEPYWWSIVVFASLAIVILFMRYVIY